MDMKKRPILSMGVSHEHVIKLTLFSTDVVESMQTGFGYKRRDVKCLSTIQNANLLFSRWLGSASTGGDLAHPPTPPLPSLPSCFTLRKLVSCIVFCALSYFRVQVLSSHGSCWLDLDFRGVEDEGG